MNSVPLWRRYARFFGPDPAADVNDELRFHLEAKIDDLLAQGWAPGAARQEAERGFGDLKALGRIGETIGGSMQRRRHLREYWNDSRQDVRYTMRTLARDPAFAIVSVLILALAVGANIAVFSVVDTLLLRPLPFPQADQLVWIAPPPTKCGLSCSTYSIDAYEEFRDRNRAFQDVTGYFAFSTADNLALTGPGNPAPGTSIDVISNFFQVLGVQPEMGRLFTDADRQLNAPGVVLLTHAWWKRQFNADPNIIGKPLNIVGGQLTIIGVLPASFDFGAVFSPATKVDAFTPLTLDRAREWGNVVTFIGRKKPHITVAQAAADAQRVSASLYFNKKFPATLGGYKDQLIPSPLKQYVTGKLRHSLITLWFAVGVILLIAGVNLSNLLLARAAARAKEFAVRGALGASRGRIVRQLLMESLLLSFTGAALGLAFASALIAWLAHQGSVALPLLSTLHVNTAVLGWTVLLAIVTATIFGLLPGLRMSSVNLQQVLKDSGSGAGLGRRSERIRTTLVISEVALACVLLVSAGLLLRSFLKVLEVDLGFQPDQAASLKVEYDDSAPSREAAAEKRGAIFQQILEQVAAVPGVEAAGITDYLPLGPNRAWDSPVPQGKSFNPGSLPAPLVYVITPGFLRALGIHVQGRDFTWADGPHSQHVVLINASAARVYWPGENAVGKILMRGPEQDHVVGVVDDVHEESVETGTSAQVYYPVTQQSPSSAQLVVRTRIAPAALASDILRKLRERNPNQPAAEFRPIRTIVDRAVSPRRFFMLLVASFAALGLVMATLGIYGVISYSVTQKTPEIGVRMALGATTGRVQRDVILSTLRLAALGILMGTAASLASARLIASLLFATSPWDVTTYAGMVISIGCVALASGYLPARRASRVDPLNALRAQ